MILMDTDIARLRVGEVLQSHLNEATDSDIKSDIDAVVEAGGNVNGDLRFRFHGYSLGLIYEDRLPDLAAAIRSEMKAKTNNDEAPDAPAAGAETFVIEYVDYILVQGN